MAEVSLAEVILAADPVVVATSTTSTAVGPGEVIAISRTAAG